MTFMVGNIVFAKIRGHSQWPATIMSVDDEGGRKKFKLTFFGTNQTAYCTISCLSSFEETKQILLNKSSIKKSLKDAITEAEIIMNQSTCTASSHLNSKEDDLPVLIHCPISSSGKLSGTELCKNINKDDVNISIQDEMLSSLVEENKSLREELHSTKFNMSLRENAIEEKFFDNITSLNSKIELLENDNNMLNIKLNEMKHMKLSAELVTLQLEDESKASLEKAESIEKRYGILNKELYSLKSKLADSRALVTDLETKNEDLITQLKTQSKKVTVLQNSLVEKKTKTILT
ncbi:hypothetical protein J6590_022509 [Homalodisca vitripennis]|nr:hypothetical protein J6590_022509 [Homalodisca vitripennis]